MTFILTKKQRGAPSQGLKVVCAFTNPQKIEMSPEILKFQIPISAGGGLGGRTGC